MSDYYLSRVITLRKAIGAMAAVSSQWNTVLQVLKRVAKKGTPLGGGWTYATINKMEVEANFSYEGLLNALDKNRVLQTGTDIFAALEAFNGPGVRYWTADPVVAPNIVPGFVKKIVPEDYLLQFALGQEKKRRRGILITRRGENLMSIRTPHS